MAPLPDTQLVCVSNFPVSTYSGMLPGVLAGDYQPEQMTIDLVRLSAAAGAVLVLDEVVGLDIEEQRLHFKSRPPVRFDALSIGIGSVPTFVADIAPDAPLVAIKPMQTFRVRLAQQLQHTLDDPSRRRIEVTIVGGGVAGVEVALCLPQFLSELASGHGRGSTIEFSLTLVQKNEQILPHGSHTLRRRALGQLAERGVALQTGRAVEQLGARELVLNDGTTVSTDLVLWATGATAPPLLTSLGLPTDERGFLLTDRTLKSTADVPVFAVGDSGTIRGENLPKAGVYAVRQGPILWDNLQRLLEGDPLRPYRPQRRFLKLLNCGDKTALGEYGSASFHGGWVWKLKDRIDTRFVEKFQKLPRMQADADAPPMRCHGCGSKLAADDLFEVLRQVRQAPASEDLPVGLADLDDAAVVRVGGRPLVLTTDFFPMPLQDAWLSGRVAALHAMSDIYAMGAHPTAAMAIVSVPPGPSLQQRQLLTDLLQGSQREFRAAGTALVGGHSTEGPEVTIGFSVIGEPWGERLCRKGTNALPAESPSLAGGTNSLSEGDCLVLTKPLGTGVLLAGNRQAACRAGWYEPLLEHLLSSVNDDARAAWELGAQWMTDVSGFGLAGHSLELLRGQPVGAELDLHRIPLLAGAVEVSEAGIVSSLFAANRDAAMRQIDLGKDAAADSRLPLLFDPQTCGGLLVALPPSAAATYVRQRQRAVFPPVVIGRITTTGVPGHLRIVTSAERDR
jgi:selenide, water dikinase